MRIDDPQVGSHLLDEIWKFSLFDGIFDLDSGVTLTGSEDLKVELPQDKPEVYHRGTDMVRANLGVLLGDLFYQSLVDRYGLQDGTLEPPDGAATVLLNIHTYIALRPETPWGELRAVVTRYIPPNELWYAGVIGKFGHKISLHPSGHLKWGGEYRWGFEWNDPALVRGVRVSAG